MKFTERFARQPRLWILAEMALAAMAIGFLDYRLPFAWTMFVFYACPILITGLCCTRRDAIGLAVFCVVVFWVANVNSQPNTFNAFIWIAVNRFVSYLIVALAGSAMRQQREAVASRLQEMEHTRELEEALVRVSEREQMRIGQDLHDGLCQHLAALDCAVTCLKEDLLEKNLEEAETAGFIQKQLSVALREARNLAHGIFPVQINEEGFLAALQELVRTLNRLRQFAITLQVPGEVKIYDPQVGMHLYRIAQEALNNVVRHAKATAVTISLTRQNGTLTMAIADNGVGLGPKGTVLRGMGMQTMRYRTTSMGGTLEALPGVGGGTRIVCKVPLAATPAPVETPAYDHQLATA